LTMAIYHLSVSVVSRSTGRSAVAAAAYRAGVCLRDERTGLVHDYTRRGGVLSAEVIAPPGCAALDRERLWQAAEAAERRRDARTAREVRIALPAELDAEACRDLARQYARWLAERYRTAVDVAVHAPDPAGDQRNRHAHLLLPTREVGADGAFGAKLRVLDDRVSGPAEIEAMREAWERLANAALAAAGVDARIDRRSLVEQGITDRPPSWHRGPGATALERRGVRTEVEERWQDQVALYEARTLLAQRRVSEAELARLRAEAAEVEAAIVEEQRAEAARQAEAARRAELLRRAHEIRAAAQRAEAALVEAERAERGALRWRRRAEELVTEARHEVDRLRARGWLARLLRRGELRRAGEALREARAEARTAQERWEERVGWRERAAEDAERARRDLRALEAAEQAAAETAERRQRPPPGQEPSPERSPDPDPLAWEI